MEIQKVVCISLVYNSVAILFRVLVFLWLWVYFSIVVFLFEVHLLYLSLHIEVLSFEDSERSRGR